MKLGIITSQTDVSRALWLALPLHVKRPLTLAHPNPGDVPLAEIRRQIERTAR